jgi:hypothetical protein
MPGNSRTGGFTLPLRNPLLDDEAPGTRNPPPRQGETSSPPEYNPLPDYNPLLDNPSDYNPPDYKSPDYYPPESESLPADYYPPDYYPSDYYPSDSSFEEGGSPLQTGSIQDDPEDWLNPEDALDFPPGSEDPPNNPLLE